ncbi:MAG TPA: Rrf2 family transcriptional regulator [bacterium]|nr:Rrf2 family transcriptional regulator [bacterium]
METMLKISDAASLALHATVFLASNPDSRFSNRQIASELQVSEAHLSKVLQRLSKSRLVKSNRGAKGGFVLGKSSDDISLLDVFESIEGPFVAKHCILNTQVCNENNCIFGHLLKSVEKQVYDYLSGTILSDLSDFFNNRNTESPNYLS